MNVKTLAHMFKNYRWQSFLFKNFIVVFSILIFPLATFSFVICSNYRDNMIQNIELSNSKSTMLMSDFLDRQLSEIENFYINIKSSDLYSQDLLLLVNSTDIKSDAVIESLDNISEYIEQFMLTNKLLSSVYIYSDASDYVYSSGSPSSNDLSLFQDKAVITDDTLPNNSPFFRTVQINKATHNMISFVYPINSSKVIFNINTNSLNSQLTSINSNLNDLHILNTDNIILYSQNNTSDVFSDGSKLVKTNYKIDKNNNLLSCTESSRLNLKYIFTNHYPDYTKTKHSYIYTVFLLVFLVLSLNIFISITLTIALYKHILSLVDILNPYIPLEESTSQNEIQLITNSILAITSQNSDMREELTNRLNALKTTQASMLQTQINPHFLYNTLNSINSIVLFTFKKDNKVSEIISNLSEILRYSSNVSEYLVSLDTELYYLEKYIDIQQAKYINRFSIEYNIDDATKNLKLIKLSLQPIVENAIVHGILPKRLKGSISLSSRVQNNALIIEISDNGIGMSDDKLNELNEKINNDIFLLDKSLGIENTAKRIRLIFGNDYGLKISSYSTGTTIILTLPIIE